MACDVPLRRTSRRALIAAMAVAILTLTGCSDGGSQNDAGDGLQDDAADGQGTERDAWRLLADQLVGEPYRTGIAADADAYDRLWASVGFEGDLPEVDFESEVVLWFGAVYASSCPRLRLDGLDTADGGVTPRVHAQILELSGADECTADANPRAFLVAVERAWLPEGPFVVQLDADGPSPATWHQRTFVDVDLREPGVTIPDDGAGSAP